MVRGVVYPASNYRLGHVIVFAALVPLVFLFFQRGQSILRKASVHYRFRSRVYLDHPQLKSRGARDGWGVFGFHLHNLTAVLQLAYYLFSVQNDVSRSVSSGRI
jgi:hypothetical protein